MSEANNNETFVVATSPSGAVVIDRELFTGKWPFWGRYAVVLPGGYGRASTDSLQAAKDILP